MKLNLKKHIVVLGAAALLLLSSCSAIRMAPFDQYSYQQAISLKVESTELLDQATGPYADHEEEVNELLKEVAKMLEYEKNKEDNNITFRMWEILADEERNLLAGLLLKWKEDGQLNEFFRDEAVGQVQEAFDLIIKFEAKKDKESKDNLLGFISSVITGN